MIDRSLLVEKIIHIPSNVLEMSVEVLGEISKDRDKLMSKCTDNYYNPYIDDRYKDFLKFKDLRGNNLSISIGLYNDENDAGCARMDSKNGILLINLSFLPYDEGSWREIVNHELVHAMDPKVNDMALYRRMYQKSGAEPDKNIDKYQKSAWEYDAFSSSMINKLSTNIKKTTPEYRTLLIQMLSDIKNKTVEEVLKDSRYESMPWIFLAVKDWNNSDFDDALSWCKRDLEAVKVWTKKPTLYKRFMKRLGTELV